MRAWRGGASFMQRKEDMASLSDAFLALPGGVGTLDELFEMMACSQLGFQDKPCGLLNVAGYYDRLLEFLDDMVEQDFVSRDTRDQLLVETEPAQLLDRLASQLGSD